MRTPPFILAAALILLAATAPVRAQTRPTTSPSTPDPAQILQDLHKLATTGRVLMVAAHPDDENTQLITYLARARGYRTAYLSITRGDGGQNVLGPEFGDELGLIRTQELLAARRLDGGEQFFTRARDFGFSKSPEETLRIWGKEDVLGDVVRVIRTFRPDVIVTRFSPTGTGTHGHHTASAILALEAFKLAGDAKAYPEQLASLETWQPKRIMLNGGFGGGGGENAIRMDVSGEDPVLHLSYAEIAGRSRAMHRSQGFGNFAGGRAGARSESFTLLAGEPAKNDIMDGVDTTWKRYHINDDIDGKIAAVIARFDPNNPSASIPAIATVRDVLANDPARTDGAFGFSPMIERLLEACAGLKVETTTPGLDVVPGSTISLRSTITLAPNVRGTVKAIAGIGKSNNVGAVIPPGETFSTGTTMTVPMEAVISQPDWLVSPGAPGLYHVSDPSVIGLPEQQTRLVVFYSVETTGAAVTPTSAVASATNHHQVGIVAPISLSFPSDVRLFAPGEAGTVTVTATAHRPAAGGTVRLDVPAGWTATPASAWVNLAATGDKATVTFTVTPPAGEVAADLHASVKVGDAEYNTGYKEINYPHIPRILLQPRALVRAVAAPVACAAKEVGYYPGAGDSVAECVTEMGCHVTTLTPADLDAGKLAKFDAVVIGVRAFNVRAELREKGQALFDYAAAGGTVVEQYNRPDRMDGVALGPYPLRLSGLRVTDEAAAVKLLAPEHRALNVPNKITAADFDGWVQERGIYYPTSWDDHWVPLLAAHDPGEEDLNGALLVAQHGKGYFVYTGLVFFRQLPAGVPGAYRLFANLVSLGKHGAP